MGEGGKGGGEGGREHFKHFDLNFLQIENGFVTDSKLNHFYLDEARVQCHRGYRLVGSPIVKCGPDGVFVDLPQCQGQS